MEPTLVIAGRQDVTAGYRDAWHILESYPRATFAVLDRADPWRAAGDAQSPRRPRRRLACTHLPRGTEGLTWS